MNLQFWLESGCVYGYRKIHLDLRDTGQLCGVNRVWRLMNRAGIKAQVGYRSPRARKGEASIVAPNRLQRQLNPDPRRLAVSGRGGGSVLPESYRLVNATPDDKRHCPERITYGCVAP
ncbi:IS3 family transposase [Buttiauxella sp. B2]|uniref:IS3 family transposase n=1 Tax=Buttiauxella sp. B2 TaxID=2587812 RepID=UPI00351A9673